MWCIERMVCLQYQCTKPCSRKNAGCKEDHMCTKECYEECGGCMIRVERKLPHCEHSGRMPCYMDPERYLCRRRCNRILPCEHPCPSLCSVKCGNCQVQVSSKSQWETSHCIEYMEKIVFFLNSCVCCLLLKLSLIDREWCNAKQKWRDKFCRRFK